MRADLDLRLRRFEPFAALSPSELDLVSRHSRRLLIPAHRWLLRPGRALREHHFLLKGSVARLHPERVVVAGQPSARAALYPGATGLRTITACEFLQVRAAVFDLLRPAAVEPLIQVGEADDCWQRRFLGSELLTALPVPVWQRLLSSLSPQALPLGAWVIREGEKAADSCYVLTAGSARVVLADRVLARLAPGDLFGEDALITGEPRNASVRMDSAGQVMAMAAADFRTFLVKVLFEGAYSVPPVSRDRPRSLVRFTSSRDLRARITRLPVAREYLVSSSLPEVEALAIFLMRKKGLVAWAAPGAPRATGFRP